MAREAVVRGTVQPSVDDRALEQETSRIERSLDRAAEITPSFDLGGLGRAVGNLLPGGAAAGGAVSRIQGKMSSTTQQQTSVSSSGRGSPVVRELKRIRVLLEKDALSGGGGGGGNTIIGTGVGAGAAIAGGAFGLAGGALGLNAMFGEQSNTEVLEESSLQGLLGGRPELGQNLGESLFSGTLEDPLSDAVASAIDAPFEEFAGITPSDIIADETGLDLSELLQVRSVPELADAVAASDLPELATELATDDIPELASGDLLAVEDMPTLSNIMGEAPGWADRLFGGGGGGDSPGRPSGSATGRGPRFDTGSERDPAGGDGSAVVNLGDLNVEPSLENAQRQLERAIDNFDWQRELEGIAEDVLRDQIGL